MALNGSEDTIMVTVNEHESEPRVLSVIQTAFIADLLQEDISIVTKKLQVHCLGFE